MAATASWRTVAGAVVVLLGGVSTGHAGEDWARAMFDHTTHDFGVVARGAKVEHRFIIENIYEEDAHVESLGRVAAAPHRT